MHSSSSDACIGDRALMTSCCKRRAASDYLQWPTGSDLRNRRRRRLASKAQMGWAGQIPGCQAQGDPWPCRQAKADDQFLQAAQEPGNVHHPQQRAHDSGRSATGCFRHA